MHICTWLVQSLVLCCFITRWTFSCAVERKMETTTPRAIADHLRYRPRVIILDLLGILHRQPLFYLGSLPTLVTYHRGGVTSLGSLHLHGDDHSRRSVLILGRQDAFLWRGREVKVCTHQEHSRLKELTGENEPTVQRHQDRDGLTNETGKAFQLGKGKVEGEARARKWNEEGGRRVRTINSQSA